MSKRLYIVVEGDTEEQFVKAVLTPYFNVSYGLRYLVIRYLDGNRA